MPSEADSKPAGASLAALDIAKIYVSGNAPAAPRTRGKKLGWGPAILVWLALSLAGWTILAAIGWAVGVIVLA